jgi:holo-[acyl-carrier protein] synthase
VHDDGVVAAGREVVEIAEVGPALAGSGFSEAERAYAASKPDPERRLAARLAAKRAAVRLLGGAVRLDDVEVLRGRGGPPRIRLSPLAQAQLRARGAERILVSLTHGETHAAAAVLLVRGTD